MTIAHSRNGNNHIDTTPHLDTIVFGGLAAGLTVLGGCAGKAEGSKNRIISGIGFFFNRTCTAVAVTSLVIGLIIQIAKTALVNFVAYCCKKCSFQVNCLERQAQYTKDMTFALFASIYTLTKYSSSSYHAYQDCCKQNENKTFLTIMGECLESFHKKNAQTMQELEEKMRATYQQSQPKDFSR